MKNIPAVMTLFLCAALSFPDATAAQVTDPRDVSPNAWRFDAAPSTAADPGPPLSLQKERSPGGQMLRNALIGAGVGAAIVGVFAARGIGGDCRDCGDEYAKAILGGAVYGALLGAAIRIHPSRHPSPGRPQRPAATVSPRVGKHVKAVNLSVRF